MAAIASRIPYWPMRAPLAGRRCRSEQCRLSEIPRHVLRVECIRCARIVEIQKADAAASRHHRDRRTGPTTDVVGPSALPALPLTPYIVAITSHVGLGTELKTDQEAA